MMDNGKKYGGFWEGGQKAFDTLEEVLENTKYDMVSDDPAKRCGALVSRASAWYSCVKHGKGVIHQMQLLAKAKTCLTEALKAAPEPKNLNPDQNSMYYLLSHCAAFGFWGLDWGQLPRILVRR